MADSGAVRQQRYRCHRAGDHHLCHHWPQPAPVSQLPAAAPGEDFDPAAEMRALAGRLLAAYQADPANAALAREARMTLLAIADPGDDPDWQELVNQLSTPAYPDPG